MHEVTTQDWWLSLLDHPNTIPLAGMLVGAVALLSGAAVVIAVTKLWFVHRQRMAMIARGMHPDAVMTELVDEPTSSVGSAHVPEAEFLRRG